ncbi:hypothetical protein DM860_016076 [Cuscuta australis]|uniref:Zinc finger GRF-type domain-containing protein n=1 Tax=Cuscuta australis TaxID=267555 RepID=A0A328E2T8_9ASTE|nr:hypothetical protein DM860_016076 [Cuscuta australis]
MGFDEMGLIGVGCVQVQLPLSSSVMAQNRCGKDMKMLTSWTKSNPGRRFWTCAGNGTRKCKSWDWIDPEICDRAKKIIPGLLDKINEKDREMEKLKNRNKQKKRMNVIPFMFGLGVGLVIHYLYLVLFM